MATKRSTYDVAALKTKINDMILNSDDTRSDFRIGVAIVLEDILRETGNYNGFDYLNAEEMKKSFNGKTVGIHTEYDDAERRFKDTDKSRVRYY